MASINNVSITDTRRASTLSPPLQPDTQLEDANSSVLTTTVDGGAGLTTATAAKSTSSVRSRSRSPHPLGSTTLQHGFDRDRSQELGNIHGDGHIFELGTRDNSIDLHSFLSSPGNGSHTELSSLAGHGDPLTSEKEPISNLRSRLAEQWEAQKGLFMIVLAVFFGALMGAVARLMQTGPAPMHTFQILFARMSITVVLSLAYMRWQRTPDAPLGPPGVRKLLVARGMGGFFGVFGLYYSVRYLPLGEATVITFLAPMVTNAVCSVLLKEPFTKREQLAGFISLVGVVFIARPTSFFTSTNTSASVDSDAPYAGGNSTISGVGGTISAIPEATPVQRLMAVLMALLGVGGAACAYTTIRWIGKRAHPLISVTYFSTWCTIVSVVALLAVPGISFRFPNNVREWLLLLSLGVFGMFMQFLLTAGLARQKGSAATNMTYTQMIFVLVIDYVVWGTVMTWSSWVGCVLILASQVWGVMARGNAMKDGGRATGEERDGRHRPDEEVGLVGAAAAEDERDDLDGNDGIPRADAEGVQLEMREMNLTPSTNNER